ncbi:hypothetical protein [Streptomyces sp. NPDC000880]
MFRIVATADGDLDVLRDGTARYRVGTRPRVLAGLAAGAWYRRTPPSSHFTGSPVRSRLPRTAGSPPAGDRLGPLRGDRRERTPAGEILAAYRDHFGLMLDQVPVPRPPFRTGG